MTPRPRCTIVPPYLLRHLSADPDPSTAGRAARTLEHDRRLRAERPAAAPAPTARPGMRAETPVVRRALSDARHGERLPGTLVRSEGDPDTGDVAVTEAWDGFGDTWRLFWAEYGRDSVDGAGLTLAGTVHYGRDYDNAFWDGERMVFGDGDGEIFGRFTASIDVIGHELTHGVTQYTAGLRYAGQPGALNEHLSDVFGVLVRQRALGHDAAAADWLIGADLLLPGVAGVALRNMLHPGTAYDDPRLGRDPQPDRMSGYIKTTDDNGGVHLNSGIPDRAFAVAAMTLGGPAWGALGRVWYDVLTGDDITPTSDFAGFAALTVAAAGARFGATSAEADAVRAGWEAVEVTPTAAAPAPSGVPAGPPAIPAPEDTDLTLRRTGGFAGLVSQRTTSLDELPRPDARRWSKLLVGDELARRAARERRVADGFDWVVCSECLAVDVTVPEEHLTAPQRALFVRTLRPSSPGAADIAPSEPAPPSPTPETP